MARGGRFGDSGGDSSSTSISGDNGDNILGYDQLGLGAYSLSGGKGNDTYYVDGDDVIDEKNRGGVDLVISTASYTLGDNLEDLTLDGAAVSGTGNALDNVLTGTGGANSLYGGGGDDVLIGGGGADFLDGGSGTDTAVLADASTAYSFEWVNGDLLVTSGIGTTDTLRDVEFVQFSDGLIPVDALPVGTGDPPPPQAVDDDGNGAEDSALVIAVLDNDQGQGLEIAAASGGAIGSVTINANGTITYRPAANAFGTDHFTYTIRDSMGRESTATVTVEVLSDNDVPVVVGESFTVAAGETLDGSSVLANDSDVDGDPLTIAGNDPTSAAGGSVVMNADGTFAYTPATGFTGTDSFTYTVSDGHGGQATGTVAITVDPAAPQAAPDFIVVDEDGSAVVSVLANDSGDGLSVASATNGSLGSTAVNADGTVTYTPAANANGADSFSYTVIDSLGREATASVSVTVNPVNDAPVAQADSYAALAGETFTSSGSVLDNDSDADGDPLAVTAFDATSANGGAVHVNADGTFTYTPLAGFTGQDSFSYTASDGNGAEASADVTLSVADTSAPPYYVEGLLYNYDYMRLNAPADVGTSVTVTYTILDTVPSYIPESDPRGIYDTFRAFTEQQQDAAHAVFAMLESFTNLKFVEASSAEQATITLGLYDFGGDTLGAATYPSGNSVGNVYSDVWIDTDLAGDSFIPGTEAYYVLLHEIGHAIGINHPDLPAVEENRQYTVMHYAGHPTMSGDVTTYQIYDIAALQYLYGANTSYASGDDSYRFGDFDGRIATVWDGAGHDLLDMSDATYGVNLDLRDGHFSTVTAAGMNNLAIAYGTLIEDAVGGAYDDRITGNDLDNVITGGAGNDVLTGLGGADTYSFGTGWGDDTITDFTPGEDKLDLAGTGLSFAGLDVSSAGGDTLISDGANSILLLGVASVDADDLILA